MNWTLHYGDARSVIETLPDQSVNCIVTSPPYWGLRDYGTARWEGGGAGCDHRQQLGGEGAASGKQNTSSGTQSHQYRHTCGKCCARRTDEQIGLEPSPDAFVAALVGVFSEARRVLRDDGVCWLNLGDSYSGSGKGGNPNKQCISPKNLIGIPWRVAFALQADGWYLRSDVIWAKPNPMPESVTDRPTKAHEYVFLLTKSPRYWYDAEAIAEPSLRAGEILDYTGDQKNNRTDTSLQATRPKGRMIEVASTRNVRTVWNIPTEASPYEHFAVMPKALARRCILAGCPSDGIVLDPFAGVCTTGVVALEEGRSFVGVELNPKYHAMGRDRLANTAPLLAAESASHHAQADLFTEPAL